MPEESQNGVSSFPFFKSTAQFHYTWASSAYTRITEITEILHLSASNTALVGLSQLVLRRSERDDTPSFSFSLAVEVLQAKPVLGFCCRSWEVMMVSETAWFPPITTPLQPNPLKHPLCLPGRNGNNCRKNIALVSPPIPGQSRSCFVFWLTNTEAAHITLPFVFYLLFQFAASSVSAPALKTIASLTKAKYQLYFF